MRFPRLTAKFEALETDITRVSGTLRQEAKQIGQSLGMINASISEAEARSRQGLATIAAGVEETAGVVAAGSSTIRRSLDETRDAAERARDDVGSVVDEILSNSRTRFQELRQILEESSNPFTEELQLQLDLLELGGTSLEMIIQLFGDAEIEGKRLREFLEDVDFRTFERDVQAMMMALRNGSAEIGELLQFLNERGGEFGQTIAGWIQALQSGELSLERLRQLIDNLQQQVDGTDLDEFLDAIEDALQRGTI